MKIACEDHSCFYQFCLFCAGFYLSVGLFTNKVLHFPTSNYFYIFSCTGSEHRQGSQVNSYIMGVGVLLNVRGAVGGGGYEWSLNAGDTCLYEDTRGQGIICFI